MRTASVTNALGAKTEFSYVMEDIPAAWGKTSVHSAVYGTKVKNDNTTTTVLTRNTFPTDEPIGVAQLIRTYNIGSGAINNQYLSEVTQRDKRGQITQKVDANNYYHEYEYDNLSRIQRATEPLDFKYAANTTEFAVRTIELKPRVGTNRHFMRTGAQCYSSTPYSWKHILTHRSEVEINKVLVHTAKQEEPEYPYCSDPLKKMLSRF